MRVSEYRETMGKRSNRERLLDEGFRVLWERGYSRASVREIIKAAEVPQGSFTYHFRSKEAFCLEVMEIYIICQRRMIDDTLLNETLPPLVRLEAYLEAIIGSIQKSGVEKGCLLGNLSVEASVQSACIRRRLIEVFGEQQSYLARCLRDAVRLGDLPTSTVCGELAAMILNMMQGAILRNRIEREGTHLLAAKEFLMRAVSPSKCGVAMTRPAS
jgi:TetR/AcrR family transcriptional regulator, transcriptional repressor for nem operon